MFIILFYLTTFLFYQFYLKSFYITIEPLYIIGRELNHKPYIPHVTKMLISFELTLNYNW